MTRVKKVESNKDHCFWNNYRDKHGGCTQQDLNTCCGFCKEETCEYKCKDNPSGCKYCCTEEDLAVEKTVVVVEEPKPKRKYVKREFKVSDAEVLKRKQEKENSLKGG